ncbi:hypothetical protein NQ318_020329 [Aromia moschata]|uniref:NF-kappa-B inhibitor-interacting Ras-like protein n=1 Tax=Aromia moschata TaxID=1265417 RepID=A0AAV8X1B1_9CUCU|nr:hypothetical protein NQ318_020329 [Aromia moschata]
MGKISKVVVCGMKGVGKTAILEQVVYGNITEGTELHPTIEDIYVANIESDKGTREKMRFYDTAGIEHSQTATAPRHDQPAAAPALPRSGRRVTIIVIANRIKEEEGSSEESTVNRATQWCNREKIRHSRGDRLETNELVRPVRLYYKQTESASEQEQLHPVVDGEKSNKRPELNIILKEFV